VTGTFGVADDLARARNNGGRDACPRWHPHERCGEDHAAVARQHAEGCGVIPDKRVGAWEVLQHRIAFRERDGLPAAGAFLASARERADAAIDTGERTAPQSAVMDEPTVIDLHGDLEGRYVI
jgi:putative DNA methylase